jgi:hypothetical protein
MNVKEQVMKAVAELPDDADMDDIIERLLFLEKLERAIKQADAGSKVAHEEFKERFRSWLK